MQVIYKIAEKQRKTRVGFMQLMDYISRDSFKTFGVGTSDNKNIAIKHYLSNKDLHKKNRDGKDRFTYHVMASFGVDVPLEKVIEIVEEFCTENFYDKGFNSFFAVHTDTNNIHCHIIADNVNFNTGNMIHSVTEKQYESMSQKKKEKAETFVYEHQRKLFEDICIKHGLDISLEERYEYMHEQKVKEGRKWLTKEQYRAKQDKDSWSNEIKNRLEEIYKSEDVNEDNIKDIANKYGLEVTRRNKDKKYITFALLDEQGKRTNQKLKLMQELNKKKRKTQEEVTKDNVKLAVKLNTLETQEKELKKDSSENVFNYDNFFGGKKKEEIEKREETREEILEFFAKEKEKLRIRKEKEAEAKAKEDEEKKSKPVRPNTYIVEDSKPNDFELEKEYKTEKEILDNFYQAQEEKKKEEDSKAKALEEEIKNIKKAEIDKITKSDEVLRRLNTEELERQAESKAKKEQEEKAKHKQVDIDSLLEKVDSYKLIEKYDLFDTLPQFKVTLNEESILFDSETGEGDIELAKNLIRAKGDEYRDNIDLKDIRTWEDVKMITTYYYDSYDELNRYNDYNEYSRDTIKQFLEENTSIAEELAYIYNMQDSNSKTYEDTKVASVESVEKQVETKKEQEEEEKQDLESKEKEIAVAEIVESKQELTNSESVITNSEPTITESKEEITSSKQEEQEEKEDLESKQVDLDSLMSKIDSYKLVKEYSLFDTLPPFQVIGEDLIYDSSSGEGDIELAKELITDVKGKEYWDNMNVKDIKQWEETGVFTVGYIDDNDNFKYNGYEDYSKSTIKQFLEENTTITEELAKQYMQDSDSKTKDSKDYEVEKKKDREIDFN